MQPVMEILFNSKTVDDAQHRNWPFCLEGEVVHTEGCI